MKQVKWKLKQFILKYKSEEGEVSELEFQTMTIDKDGILTLDGPTVSNNTGN